MKVIHSETNAEFKRFLKLTKARGVKKHGLTLFSGPKQVREVLKEFPDRCKGIIFAEHHVPFSEMVLDRIPGYRLNGALFRQLDLYDTGYPILLINVAPFPQWDETDRTPGCTLCVPFQDPANVGAVIRSAAAFGVTHAVFLKEAAHPFHHKSARVAGSALFRVPIFEGPSIQGLNGAEMPVITLSPRGRDVEDFEFPDRFCLVPGLEGPGLPDHFDRAAALSIPMAPGVESINAAMATGIILYLWRRKGKSLGKPLV